MLKELKLNSKKHFTLPLTNVSSDLKAHLFNQHSYESASCNNFAHRYEDNYL